MIFTYPTPDPKAYATGEPFPHIAIHGAWDATFLKQVADEFPDLDKVADRKFNNKYEGKLVTHGEAKLSPAAKQLIRECNSETFLLWLSELTGIRHLMPDPYLIGGGYHEIKPGGKLGVHVDFNKHGLWGADRRINVLIYLNEEWKEEWLGGIGLYNKEKRLVKRYTPDFNTMVVFSTTDDSWHGHPEPLQCPQGRSRKSIALYYYTAPDIDWHARDTVFTDAK
jgi:hypothetical protein